MEVVATATEGESAIDAVVRMQPDFLLLDLDIERVAGLEVLSRVASHKSATRTVIVTNSIDSANLRVALLRGARGVLLKHMTGDLLIKCIRQVMKGEYWVGRDTVGDLVEALRKSQKDAPGAVLSDRERDIVNAVLKGASNKDIAWQLGLGEQTVKNHLRRIFAKLGVANRVELAVHAMARQSGEPGGRPDPAATPRE
jgi:two-component system nitrate/nitrite response regulator NarL